MAQGFYGLLDFTGVPVGVPGASVGGHGGFRGAGKHRVAAIIAFLLERDARRRSVLDGRKLAGTIRERVVYDTLQEAMIEAHRRSQIEVAMYSVTLAEL